MILLDFKTKIKGSTTIGTAYKDQILLQSYAFNVSKHVQVQGSERPSSPAFMSELMFTKTADISSPNLFSNAIEGTSLGVATIVVLHTEGAKKNMPAVTIKLDDAVISSFSSQSAGAGQAAEHFSLNFTTISYEYHKFNGDKADGSVVKKFDLRTKVTS
ncbi:type VI secretion system tube protein Hcp [Pseudomonas versuta]|uniref:Type VI secretion system tube protein Hcp n=1 Tax=Pseudomonas versuta TaxID=1788301 RepID=A0ABX3E5K1_9PSED|nr:type VI secretion system tube protein Hcp [Pseudomonas versuta]ALE87417.1 hypothetical protein AOC04_03945 [Pseudomonas versuta]OKA20132.1 hypothetical protein BOH73_13960 [Pseudomonas versuta]